MDEQTGDFFQGEATDFAGGVNTNDFGGDPFGADGAGGGEFYENIGDVDYTDGSGAAAPDAAAGADAMQYPPAVMVADDGAGSAGEDNGMMEFAANSEPMYGEAPQNDVMVLGGEDMNSPPTEDAPTLIEPIPDEPSEPPAESPMAIWNREFQETLKTRKDEENAMKAEAVEKAQKELEEFQAQREKKRETRMAKNRADEQQKLEDMEADLENDNSWQRVNKMVELQQDTVEGARDKKRIIDVLIKMKNNKEMAEKLS